MSRSTLLPALLLAAAPALGWEVNCGQVKGKEYCAVLRKEAPSDRTMLMLSIDEGRLNLGVARQSWEKFYPHLGKSELSASFDGGEKQVYDKKGNFRSADQGFIFAFGDRQAARKFIRLARASQNVEFTFSMTRVTRGGKPAGSISFSLDGFSEVWDLYCQKKAEPRLCSNP